MVKGRAISMFVVAVVLGVGAAMVANQWIEARTLMPSKTDDMNKIVVAALDIPYGTKIEGAQIKLVEWPGGSEPKGAFTDPAEVEGKISKRELLPGEPVLADRISEHIGGSTLSAIVEPNKRAISVRVNDVVGVAGFLLPGNRVDVLATRKEKRRAITSTILENIKVLAVDQTASTDKDKPVVVRSVTLEMTPRETEQLVKAREEGTLQLTLRNPTEEQKPKVAEKPKKKTPIKVVRRRSYSSKVTVIRGTAVQTATVKQ
jgi:pilus assembly protein CpaB